MYENFFEAASKEFVRIQCREDQTSHDNSYFFTARLPKAPLPMKDLPVYADRQTNRLIYNTITKLIQDSKESSLNDMKIKWEDFENFTPMQIIGVMLLKKNKLNAISSALFPKLFSET